jgi:hypothetical protein
MLKGENKHPAYLSKNPMGTVPLLELDDGTQLAESVAICRYVEELYPDPPLFGITPIERAMIEMWNRGMEFELLRPIIDHFVHSSAFYKERLTQLADIAHHGRMHAQARMRWLNGERQFPAIYNISHDGSVMYRRDKLLEREDANSSHHRRPSPRRRRPPCQQRERRNSRKTRIRIGRSPPCPR